MKLLMEYRMPQTGVTSGNPLSDTNGDIIPSNEIISKAHTNAYHCNLCDQTFSRMILLKRHKTTSHNHILNKTSDPSEHDTNPKSPDANPDNIKDINTATVVPKRKKLEPYRCIYCDDFVANGKRALATHCSEMHPDNKKGAKEQRAAEKEDVANAKMEIDGKTYYHCSECGKNLHSPYTFSWHMRIHTGERPFTCHLCGKQFRVNQGLARHLKETHAGIKNFPCDICGRMFSTKRNAEDHRRIHTGERPYVCNICGKSFKQKASLFVHNRTHTDHFPFKCSYCNQGFRTKPPLTVHITKHTGEKPYACDICQRRFRIKYELKRHRLVHFDEKPWQCADCDSAFRQKRYLVNHRKLNHSD